MKKTGVLGILLVTSILLAGCGAFFNPEALFKANPEINDFLGRYPNSDFTLVHFSAEESVSEISNIKNICGKELASGKELYKAEISDADSGLSIIAYLDVQGEAIECVRKFGIKGKVPVGLAGTAGCPAYVAVEFDKESYNIGDSFQTKVYAQDSNGNLMPNQKISIQPYKNGQPVDKNQVETDEIGVFSDTGNVVSEDDIGIYEMVAFVEKAGCPYVSNVNYFSVVSGEGAAGCCKRQTKGCASPVTEDYCTGTLVGTYYPGSSCDIISGQCVADASAGECAAKIDLEFDKENYAVGDDIKVTVDVYDSNGNRMQGKAFTVTGTKDSVNPGEEMHKTAPDTGIFEEKSTVDEDNVGEYVYRVYIKEPGCPYIVDSEFIKVSSAVSQQQVCASSLKILFDKQSYNIGDDMSVKVYAQDASGNMIPGKKFMMSAVKDGEVVGSEQYEMDSNGVFGEQGHASDDSAGTYRYDVYIEENGCPAVKASNTITVAAASAQPTQPIKPSQPPAAGQKCPAVIDVAFDKAQYKVGDDINFKVAVYSKDGKVIPGKRFALTAIRGDEGTTEYHETSLSTGIFEDIGHAGEGAVGDYNYIASIEEQGCEAVEGRAQISVSSAAEYKCPSQYYEQKDCSGLCHLFSKCQEVQRLAGCYECVAVCANDEYYNSPDCRGKCTEGVNECVVTNTQIPCYRCKPLGEPNKTEVLG